VTVELNLRFPKINQVIVKFDDVETDTLDFSSPISEEDQKDILYQAGKDTPLLKNDLTPPAPLPSQGRGEEERGKREKDSDSYSPLLAGEGLGERSNWGNLPALQEAGFFLRSRELWLIERWFVQGTRRITVSGFGGQGKTYLVQEAGRWLYRTGMFQKVCFVDYAAFQGVDAVGLAVSTLATVLDKTLLDHTS
jgi:hypothetical protein